MAVYVIGQLRVKNWDWYREYRSVTEPLVVSYGGKYLVKEVSPEPLEGDGKPDAVVVIEFPSREKAQQWYQDQNYAPMIELRRKSGVETNLVIVDRL